MNNTTPTCTVTAVPIGPWFLLKMKVEIPQGLPKRDYAEFRFNRQFAGLSPSGIPLSVKGTKDPATIGTIPLLQKKTMWWRALPNFATAGLLVLNPKPRLAFFGMRNSDLADRCTTLSIHPNDLVAIVKIPADQSEPQRNDVVIEKLTPGLINLLVQHAQQLRVVLIGDSTYVRVPSSIQLDRAEWAVLRRHILTGKNSGTLGQTTSILSHSPPRNHWLSGGGETCFKLPGHSLEEVNARWGVGETTPVGYDGTNLCFNSLHVLQGAKLGRLHPNAQRLEGRHIKVKVSETGDHNSYPYLSGYSFPLNDALDAEIVPADGVLDVDASIQTIWISRNGFQIGKLKRPILWRRASWEPTLLCPEALLSGFLVPARQAVRTYAIPGNITLFRVITQNPVDHLDIDPPAKYYLLSDLRNLAPRDLKREREERSARRKRLVERYGSALPQGYESFSDAEIALHFEIQDLVQQGEFIEFENHPLMPGHAFKTEIENWLRKEAPHLIKTCPINRRSYVRRLASFEDLAEIPRFWEAIEAAFGSVVGKRDWVRKLVISPKVQAAACIRAL